MAHSSTNTIVCNDAMRYIGWQETIWLTPMEKQRVTYYFFSLACGMVDAICFAGLGEVFVSLMTGNLILLGIAIGRHHPVAAFLPFLIPLAFYAVGTLLGGWLTTRYPGAQMRRLGFVLVWLLTLLAGWVSFDVVLSAQDLRYAGLLAILALASGLQSALLQKAGLQNFASNVMTSTLTSLLAEYPARAQQPREVLAGRSMSIGFFLVGAVLGAMALAFGVSTALFVTLVPLAVAVGGALAEKNPA